MADLQYRFNHNILKLLNPGYGDESFSILLAVSGGVDSMAMLPLPSLARIYRGRALLIVIFR